jgi:hypothetical protein
MIVSIYKAEYKGDYSINFTFNDGKEKLIDFTSFLMNARTSMTKKYLDKQLFSNFSVEYGDILWNDYEMCFPIWNLYEGKIEN